MLLPPLGKLLPFRRRTGYEYAVSGLVQQPSELAEIVEPPLTGAAAATWVQDDVELAGLPGP